MKAFDNAKKEKKNTNKKWYIINTKKYSYHILCLPIIPMVALFDYIEEYNYKKLVWNEEKAIKILDKTLPKILEWVEEDKAFYYCCEWNMYFYNYCPKKDKEWCKKFNYDLNHFLRYDYENVDYVKTIEKDYYETWIKFAEKEN